MYLVFHGGKCCGIKTIYGLGDNPHEMTHSLEPHPKRNHDKNGDEVKSDLTFFHEGAPKETGVQRLDRYIDFIRRVRPQNIIEICLAVGSWVKQGAWFSVLLERGFKEATVHKNSNTGNMIHVFHLCVGAPDEDIEISDDVCPECEEYEEDCCCD